MVVRFWRVRAKKTGRKCNRNFEAKHNLCDTDLQAFRAHKICVIFTTNFVFHDFTGWSRLYDNADKH